MSWASLAVLVWIGYVLAITPGTPLVPWLPKVAR